MISKRPCAILVADGNIAAIFRGYFKRVGWHLSLGCAFFEINTDIGADMLVDAGGFDPGVFTKGHELLRPYQNSHEHALVVLDCEWNGSPGKAVIVEQITARLVDSGWAENAIKVIAIEPELENWLWQDNPHVANVLRYKDDKSLRQHLADNDWWPANAAKPPRPKEAAEWVLRQTRRQRSSAIYQELAEKISIKGCTDLAFAEMHTAFREWFPAEVAP